MANPSTPLPPRNSKNPENDETKVRNEVLRVIILIDKNKFCTIRLEINL